MFEIVGEIKGGGRQAFRAELWALQQLQDTEAVQRGAIPAFLGADREKRRVMMNLHLISEHQHQEDANSAKKTSPEVISPGSAIQRDRLMSQVTCSLLVSALLALAWQRGQQTSPKEGEAKDFQLERLLLAPLMAIRHSNQVVPTLLVLYSASSISAALYASFTLGLHLDDGGWLGSDAVSSQRAFADKVEILFQRLQRSVKIVKSSGIGVSLKSSFAEPFSWFWPGFWGSARRFALIAVSYVGYGAFVRSALPAVVLDECLWWLLSKTQDLFTRKVCALPMILDLVLLPFLDYLHMVPAIFKVALLAFMVYPDHEQSPVLLVLCALAWTGHNCHVTKSTLLEDLPEQLDDFSYIMGYFAGVKLPDAGLAPVLSSRSDANVSTSTTSTLRALRCWLHVASAVEEANRTGVYHCDVNPWNVLIAEDDGAASQGCLVDWACSSASKAPKLHRRGDFQAAELLEGSVGPHTDVYGCASTLLWLLLKRTRKGLVEHERSRERLLEHFRETGAVEAVPALDPLAACCAWGMAEDVKERCPTLAPLLELVKNATQQMEKTTRAVRLLPS
eukprot:s435_g2.t4